MIAVFSSSSPMASVALFTDSRLAGVRRLHAPMAAGAACLQMLDALLAEEGASVRAVATFAADVGPGSFTGIKVAVTLAKTLAYATSAIVASISSFDLMSADETVVIPSRRGEWFVRIPGETPMRTTQLPAEGFVGYGVGIEPPVYPDAGEAMRCLDGLSLLMPAELRPVYLAEPSISTPKEPYRTRAGEAPND